MSTVLAALLAATLQPAPSPDAARLVQQLGVFPAAITPGGPPPQLEQRRDAIYRQLRALDTAAVPALSRGLADPDAQVRRNVALYLTSAAGNYSKFAADPLDLTPYVDPLTRALRDPDQRVKELAAQAIAHAGPAAAGAVPDLLAMLEDPAEGLRNTACIALAGIGPAARDALPALRKALSDASKTVRQLAQGAIDRIER